MNWTIAEAKQRFSEVVRQASQMPQLIYKRNRLMAAIIDAESYDDYRSWREQKERRTLASQFAQLRALCQEENYEFEIPPRTDRPDAFAELSEEVDAV